MASYHQQLLPAAYKFFQRPVYSSLPAVMTPFLRCQLPCTSAPGATTPNFFIGQCSSCCCSSCTPSGCCPKFSSGQQLQPQTPSGHLHFSNAQRPPAPLPPEPTATLLLFFFLFPADLQQPPTHCNPPLQQPPTHLNSASFPT
ncbi:hypothetical protein MRB53_006395 [Persea americana]|uniref:Uncharacterized protein n=1 Tax=Persea americana TaxID=3435 RepID=A0ACC2MG09_PERAE|nr:hypothetical protein MRB53_006395 [Persea americana]